MSVKDMETTSRKLTDAEVLWHEWLLTLLPWERHYVFASVTDGVGTMSRELDWFDDYAAGEIDFEGLNKILADTFTPVST